MGSGVCVCVCVCVFDSANVDASYDEESALELVGLHKCDSLRVFLLADNVHSCGRGPA